MKGHIVLLVVQVLMGLALFYTCFCRLTKTSSRTRREIRWAIWFEGVTGSLLAGAPFLPLMVPELYGRGHFQWQPFTTPMWVWVALLIAATLVQFVTAQFWRSGPPRDFQIG